MTRIDLTNLDKSEVKYVLTTFPDGEPHIKLDPINRKDYYLVITRITNPNELFVLLQVGDILNRQGVEFSLRILYLMSQRMDRVINFEEAFSLDIVAKMINSINASVVEIVEAHSDRAFRLINNSKPFDSLFFDGAHGRMLDILRKNDARPGKNIVICYPDHGAYDRYGKSGALDEDHIVMAKKRDLEHDGRIISMYEELPADDKNPSAILIHDDLCDGGGTFIMAADILRKNYPNAKLGIAVTHMVNESGLKKLADCFDMVFITNSYADWKSKVDQLLGDNAKKVFVSNF